MTLISEHKIIRLDIDKEFPSSGSRSTLAQNTAPVYSVAWSADSQSVLYAHSNNLTVKALAPNSKPLVWKAHDALILCADWSPSNGTIISGEADVDLPNH